MRGFWFPLEVYFLLRLEIAILFYSKPLAASRLSLVSRLDPPQCWRAGPVCSQTPQLLPSLTFSAGGLGWKGFTVSGRDRVTCRRSKGSSVAFRFWQSLYRRLPGPPSVAGPGKLRSNLRMATCTGHEFEWQDE
jgi:hypothetical protein